MIRTVGKFLISVGVGVFIFVGWTFWGTGIETARHQRRLAQQFEESLGDRPPTPGAKLFEGPPESFDPSPGDPVFRIRIPALDLNDGKGFVVVEGVGADELTKGPGHYPQCSNGFRPPLCTSFDTTWPGERGRVVVSGHRTTHLAPFRNTDDLEKGDAIVVDTAWGTFTYRVYDQRSVLPDDPTIVVGVRGARELVLTTCDPPLSAARRLITFARLVKT